MSSALSFIGAGASILGGFVGAAGAEQQAGAQAGSMRFNAAMSDYQAQLFDMQAKIFGRNREIARLNASEAARDKGKVVAATMGSIRAAYGANGLSIEGSPLDVLEATATEGTLDIKKELYKGDIEAASWTDQETMANAQATLSRAKASMARWGADMAVSMGHTSALASIIAGFAGGASAFKGFNFGGGGGGMTSTQIGGPGGMAGIPV